MNFISNIIKIYLKNIVITKILFNLKIQKILNLESFLFSSLTFQ